MKRSVIHLTQSCFEEQAASFERLAVSCEFLAVSVLQFVFMRDFKRLLIWQKAMEIVAAAYKMADLLPSEEKYGLRSQITRCAVSIAANIAEGSSRESQREYKHFCEISLGSCFELETHCLVAIKLKLVDEKRLSDLLKALEEEEKMLTAFIKTLTA
jgi:four helix bundle protein